MDIINTYRSEPQLAVYDLLGIDLTAVQSLIFSEIWSYDRALEIVSRGGGKTFLLGLVATLKCMLYPGYKVCITAPVFRQAKFVFNEIERLYTLPHVNESCNKGPLRTDSKGPFRTDSSCHLDFKPVSYLDMSHIEVLHLSRASAEAGRFDLILVDEASYIPVENLKLLDEKADKLILMSAGFYGNNLMWDLVNHGYKTRMTPYYLFPDGFFDKNNISEAKRIMSNAEFRMEYEAAIVQEMEKT
jgi:hypothetical protein